MGGGGCLELTGKDDDGDGDGDDDDNDDDEITW